MTSFVLQVKYVYDVPNQVDCIEIDHYRWIPGIGNQAKKDYLYTSPLGNWNEIKFLHEDGVSYTNFLNTMVFKNIEVQRKIAKLTLDHALESGFDRTELMNAIQYLDPTFQPPVINKRCRWQRELLDEIVTNTSLHVISTCRNMRRLDRYVTVVQSIGEL